MNERLRQLMVQADYPAPEIALRAQKLAELIVRECAAIADRAEPYKSTDLILKHFGVEEQDTESNEWHTCPYAEEIYHDYDTLCDCDEERTIQCRMDI